MKNLFKRLIVTNAFAAALLLASNAQAMEDNAYLQQGTDFADQVDKAAISQNSQAFEIDNKISEDALSFACMLLRNSAESLSQKGNHSAYKYVVAVIEKITARLPKPDAGSDEDDDSDID